MSALSSVDELFAQLMAGLLDQKLPPSNTSPFIGADMSLSAVSDTQSSSPQVVRASSTSAGTPLLPLTPTQSLPLTDSSNKDLPFSTTVPFPPGMAWELPFADFTAGGFGTPPDSVFKNNSRLSDHTSKRDFHELTSSDSDETDLETDRPIKKTRYQCETCFKYFTRPSSLSTHMYTHTGERPHECTFPGCNKRFSVLSNLRRHTRLHLDPQPRNRRKQHCHPYFMGGPFSMFPMPPLDLPHLLALQFHEQMLADAGLIGGDPLIPPQFFPAIMPPMLPLPQARLPGLHSSNFVSNVPSLPITSAASQFSIPTHPNPAPSKFSEPGVSRRLSAPPMPAPAPNAWLANSQQGSGLFM